MVKGGDSDGEGGDGEGESDTNSQSTKIMLEIKFFSDNKNCFAQINFQGRKLVPSARRDTKFCFVF